MQIELDDFDKIETMEADSRGRVTLGTDYADQEIKIVVVDSE